MKKFTFVLGLLFVVVVSSRAEIPPAEKILPDDTLALFTVPDCAKSQATSQQSAQMQFWNDPAMRPFKDKFMTKLQSELVGPLERELGISVSNYTALAQGQLTFALVQNGWQGTTNPMPGWLLLLDTKSKSDLLKTNLAELKRKWSDAGKPLKTDKIHDVEFTILLLSSNDVPATLKNLSGPKAASASDVPADDTAPKPVAPTTELYLGQRDSLLIAGNSPKVIEKVLIALAGGESPVLGEQAAFEANQLALFRDASMYGWANTKILFDILNKSLATQAADQPDQPSMLPFRPEKAIAATGLTELRTVAFSSHPSSDGNNAQVFLTAPEAARAGLLKILAGEAKETTPPPFVPADAVKFTRWRFGGQKTWDTLEKTLNDVSPQLLGGINFALMTAGASAKEKDPDFDLKKALVSNLGDDVISYQKSPRSKALADVAAPPSIFLLASPQPDKLLNALKTIFAMLNRRGDPPTEREFLGRKIYSIGAGTAQLVNGDKTGPRALSLATANGYVALSMDSATLEEFLRSGEKPGKPLREVAGFADAVAKVSGDGTSFFTYENQRETMRTTFELFKQFGSSSAAGSPTGALGLVTGQKFFKDWADVSLLPDYDLVAKYFNFTVSAGGATPEGLTLKIFAPTSPDLKK